MPRTISEAADEVGVSPHAVRYYERVGLIPPVPRDGAGRRRFDETSLEWVRYVTCLRSLGMGVGEIREYVTAMAAGRADPDLLRRHLASLRRRQAELDHYVVLVERKLLALERG